MIPVCGTKIWGNELKYLTDCVETGWFSSLGKYVRLFEETFSSKIGTKYACACSSGTSGLFTALRVLGIKEGDEVIIPDFTIIVSSNVVIECGAKPVLVDVERDTWCIDPHKIEAAITEKTKAIMVVHMYGHPAEMDTINAIAKKHNLKIIEDCCQSHGALYKGKQTGTFSDISVFSFYANKILTTGEGGLILTDNEDYAKKIKIFVDNGFEIPRFIHNTIGYNFRLSNLQAAVGLAQTEHFDEAVKRKREIAKRYLDSLKDCPHLSLPVEKGDVRSVYWMFGLLVNDSFGMTKNDVMIALKDLGIETRSFFYGMHQQPVFKNSKDPRFPDLDGFWPVSAELGRRGFYLPSGLDLSDEQIDFCLSALLSLIK